jgi:diacylglycerol kinase (ATP)
MSIAIIANPLAGRGRGQKVARLAKEILTAQKADFELLYTEYPGHAIELAEKASGKHPTVVALGGDGTIREVLQGTWQTTATLGLIPGGTGNDYARGLGIPRTTKEAIHTLLNGQKTRFDVGLQKDIVFGQMVSIGFSADVLDYVNAHRDGFWKGSTAFLAAVAATIRHLRAFPVKINIDGKVMEKNVIALFALNMPYGGGGMNFSPDARYDSGHFHLLFIEKIGRLSFSLTLPKIYSGKHVSHPAVHILPGKEISVESDLRPLMIDGDIFAPAPFHSKIVPQAMPVIVPKTPA